jgi:hypothetical protein
VEGSRRCQGLKGGRGLAEGRDSGAAVGAEAEPIKMAVVGAAAWVGSTSVAEVRVFHQDLRAEPTRAMVLMGSTGAWREGSLHNTLCLPAAAGAASASAASEVAAGGLDVGDSVGSSWASCCSSSS